MKSFKYIAASLVVAVVAAISMTGSASAAPAKCILDPLPLNKYGKSFQYSGSNVTATFTLRGEAGCKSDMSLASWEAPAADGQPVKDQKLFDYKDGSFGPGAHTLTVAMPDCYYQVDIFAGSATEHTKGMRYFDFANTANFFGTGDGHVHDANIGGTKACEKPEIPVEKPEEPKTPVTPTPAPTTPATVVTQLPSTGAGSIVAGTLGLSTTAGLAYNLIASRKKLK